MALRFRTLLLANLQVSIEGIELLGLGDTAQSEAADRDEVASEVADGGCKCRRDKQRLIDGTAHRGNPAYFIHSRADDSEIKPFLAANVAIKDSSDVKREVHVGNGQIFY